MRSVAYLLLRIWQDLTCPHHWVRARLDDGRYGYRCMDCWRLYPHTWNEMIQQTAPGVRASVRTLTPAPAPGTGKARLRRLQRIA